MRRKTYRGSSYRGGLIEMEIDRDRVRMQGGYSLLLSETSARFSK